MKEERFLRRSTNSLKIPSHSTKPRLMRITYEISLTFTLKRHVIMKTPTTQHLHVGDLLSDLFYQANDRNKHDY